MRATVLLCDWAEEINGKLYIMGAGWSRVFKIQPVTITMAVKIYVPWDQANRKHTIAARLLTEDGKTQVSGEGDDMPPVEIRGELEVGRPPGIRPGSDIDAPVVLRFQNLDLDEGRYLFVLEIDGGEVERVSFDVVVPKESR